DGVPRVPSRHQDVVIAREKELVGVVDLIDDRLGLGRQLHDVALPGIEAARAPRLDAVAADAPEEAHEASTLADRRGAEPGRQKAHEGVVPVDALVERPGRARALVPEVAGDEPERAPWIPDRERSGAEPRACAVGDDDEIVRSVS